MDNERRRSDRLHDVARRLGVETHVTKPWGIDEYMEVPRPRLNIAHECLGKLPLQLNVRHEGLGKWEPTEWDGYFDNAIGPVGTFEEAVIALAERFLKEWI